MANFDQILGYLPAFTNVRKLVISDPKIAEFCRRSLFPSHWGLGDAELLARIDLRHLFERIESLAYAVEPDNPVHVLKAAAPSLTCFTLRFADVTNGKAILSTVLSTAPHLKSLAINATGLDLDFGALTPSAETSWPTLSSLSLKAERFNASLERLEWTEEPAESENATFTFPASPALAALHALELRKCGTSPLLPLVESIKPSSIPSLGELTVAPRFHDEENEGFENSGISSTLRFLRQRYDSPAPALRYYQSAKPMSPWCILGAGEEFPACDAYLAMSPIAPYPHPVFYWPEVAVQCDYRGLFGHPVAKTMDFLASWVQRVEVSESPEDYAHLVSALRFVELERVAQTS